MFSRVCSQITPNPDSNCVDLRVCNIDSIRHSGDERREVEASERSQQFEQGAVPFRDER